jgi:hypothetical protein
MRPPRRGVTIGIYTVLITILIGVIIAAALDVFFEQWAAAVSAAVTILIALLVSLQQAASRPAPADSARKLAHDLAPQVLDNWRREITRRGLEYPGRRISVRWRVCFGSNPNSELAAGLGPDGRLEQLTTLVGRAARMNRLPPLVVTGEVGGGKTAACVLLMVELAEQHRRLPVLFQLATWDPRTSLQTWMARQLPEIFPALGKAKYDRQVASILMGLHILPILDGLDEVQDSIVALRRIDRDLSGLPFVLTCRTAEFARANAGAILHQALIVELQPLWPDEVRDILLTYEPARVDGPLASLVAILENQPTGPLAEALNTPFMVSLARDIGASLTRDTSVVVEELISAAAAPDAVDAIKRHLLGVFVEKAYQDREAFPPDRVRHYLQFLARHTDGAGRLGWWRLHLAVPRAVFFMVGVCVGGVVCSGLAAMFFALFDRPWLGAWIGLGAGIAGALTVELIPQDDPRRARPRFRSLRLPTPYELARTVGFGLMGAAALAVIVLFLYSSVRYVVIGGVLSGLTFAAARYVSQPNDPLKVVDPVSLLRADRDTVLYAWLVGAIPGALTGAYLGSSFHAGHRPAFDSLRILSYPSPVLALLGAIGGCVLSGAGLGLMATGSAAWSNFILTRLWLAFSGSTPLRLMAFLQDAYRRGILRQVNGYYEFRHQTLQRYLAEPSPDASVAASAAPVGPP